ncbi:beta strand repeat-containing protein [Pedobacter montanisoli]|uniref:Ig-like domain-containing protein n=1 Tax=Pedobacter montanisoli TaxID=2923277 RepID=A0ABS9ZZA3_9SPHI|nr:Ig-like domain-containing protein [Pedobacter montanisoli]MCJ0743646.1 Ig-like domain-containing protein [Pedobacter montanisoli]
MKKNLLKALKWSWILLLLQFQIIKAQTTLVAGDIAFTGYNSNDAGNLPNSFSFIILRAGGISATTVINFTDNGWNPLTSALGTTEGTITWTATSALAQFTEVTISAPGSTPVLQTISHGSAILNGSFILSQAGDQVLAYQGASTTPTFITGIHMNSEVPSGNSAGSSYSGWDNIVSGGFSFSVNRSSMPPGLTGTVNAIMPVINPGTNGAEKDNGKFNCTYATATSLASLKANLFDATKWDLQDITLYTLPTNCAFAVTAPPSITVQPSNSIVCNGLNTTFSISANNATGYQWQISTNGGGNFTNLTDGGVYSNVTTATMKITGATTAMNGYQYKCVVTGTVTPDATSNAATLTVNSGPAITTQPTVSTLCAGGNTVFSVTATNATGYQWQVDQGTGFTNISNGAPYSGATTATLSITGAAAGMNGYIYRVMASGSCTPAATSNSVALTVNRAPSIATQPSSRSVVTGTNTSFSVIASNATGFQWQVNQGLGFTNITNIAPYSGATSSTLNIAGATMAMDGYLYRVIVSGTCPPDVTSNTAALNVTTPVTVTSVSSSTANGSYSVGAMINIEVKFSDVVNVNTTNGTPQLTLETGATDRVGYYYAGSGTSTLIFSYTVQAGDISSDLDYVSTSALALNGGTIKDALGNDAVLTLASPGAANSLGANKAIIIDTTAPTNTIASMVFSNDTGISNLDFITNNVSQTISGTLNANLAADEVVMVSLNNGATYTYANCVVGTKSWSLVGVTLTASGTIKVLVQDLAGNQGTALAQSYTLDTTAPTAVITSSVGANGTNTSTSPIPFTVTFSENVYNFVLIDINVNNGTASNFSNIGSKIYNFDVTPTANGNVMVNIMANVGTDIAGNNNTAATPFVVNYQGTLSVRLLTFNAKAENNVVKLQWQTAAEKNNKGFEIYRSGDNIKKVKIGEVQASNLTSNITSQMLYNFVDKNPLKGNNYYQLIQVDMDGTTTDLGIRNVNFGLSASDVILYPNPTTDKITIAFTSNYSKISVLDVGGKVLQTQQLNATQKEIILNFVAYPSGTYFIKLIGNNHIETKKVIKKL